MARGMGESVRETIIRSMREVEAKGASGGKSGTSNGHDSDRNFYVAVAAYGAAFGTGLLLLAQNNWFSASWIYGVVFTLGGGVGLSSVTPLFRAKFDALRSPRSLWAVILMTWLLLAANLGFSIYDNFGRKPISSSAAATEPTTSDIVDVTPEYLMTLYKDVMSSQGDSLLKPYVGRWMRLTQTVSDVKDNSVWTYFREKPDSDPRLILLFFDNAAQLGVLRPNQQISALCQIAAAKVNALNLIHCKLENK
jgi:hypothetical protein